MRVSRRYSRICVLALAGLTSLSSGTVFAQTRVAPPTAVESAPLAPPPGASPVQMPSVPAQTPPVPVPDSQPGPQPAPTLPGPVEPQPVQPVSYTHLNVGKVLRRALREEVVAKR